MSINGTYNKDVWMPKLNVPTVDIILSYTYHALDAAKTDRYGVIELPESINLADYEIVELEIADGKPRKILIRGHYDSSRDLTMAILLRDNRVLTVWSNLKGDDHKSLRK